MAKLIRVVVLLAIVGGLIAGFMWWKNTSKVPPPQASGGPAELRSGDNKGGKDKPAVEEKYGFTSQGAGGG